jgi:hypothetical protein
MHSIKGNAALYQVGYYALLKKIMALCKSSMILTITIASHCAFAQSSNSVSSTSTKLQSRFANCDKLNSEGDYLACNLTARNEYNIEILKLESKICIRLRGRQRVQFNKSSNLWHRYYESEKANLEILKESIGTVQWVGLNAVLVEIAKSRYEYLEGQM